MTTRPGHPDMPPAESRRLRDSSGRRRWGSPGVSRPAGKQAGQAHRPCLLRYGDQRVEPCLTGSYVLSPPLPTILLCGYPAIALDSPSTRVSAVAVMITRSGGSRCIQHGGWRSRESGSSARCMLALVSSVTLRGFATRCSHRALTLLMYKTRLVEELLRWHTVRHAPCGCL